MAVCELMGLEREEERLATLRSFRILDTAPDRVFDDLAWLAAQICGTPIALLSLVDEHRQWFKARVGPIASETPRDISFCSHAIQQSDVMIVPDARTDPRFADNPLVTGEPHIQFYAGTPLVSSEGQSLGTLCVIDHVPRELTADQRRGLETLARQVMTELELHRRSTKLVEATELIREHERLAALLRTSEHRWRTIIAAEPECVKLLDREGRVLEMNPAGLAMVEADSFEQVAGRSIYELVLPKHREQIRAFNESVFRGESGVLEFELEGLRGSRRWFETHAVPLRDESGAVQSSLSITRDVTERRLSAEALGAAIVERANLINAIDGIVWEADAETSVFSFVSHQAERLLGYPIASWLTEPGFWVNHIHPDDREEAVGSCVEATRARRSHAFEYRMVAADGRVIWLNDIVGVSSEADGPVKLRGLMVDITERKAAETAMVASSERHARQRAAITELTRSQTLHSENLDAALREITESAARTLGVERASVWRFNRSRSAIECCDLFEATTGQHSSGLALGAVDYPGYFRAIQTNEIVAVDDAVTDPRTCEFADGYLKPLGIASILDAPIQVDNEIDGVLCHEHVGEPRAWTTDELSFAVSIGNLVSLAIAQSERRQMEQRFRQSQKMEAFGQLAGGVAHDFNNILAAVMMQASDAATIEGLSPYVVDALADIELASARGATLTRQLLAFSRRQMMQLRAIDLNASVTSLIQMLRRILGADVEVEVHLAPGTLVTHADPGMIDQVLMNLVINARDAMPTGGRLAIETATRVIHEIEAREMIDTAPGRYVCLRVTDSGCGIPPENLGRIFEPFFTTKEPGKGTGLGLATVFGIVKQHRGVVQVDSAAGQGATFTVMFPATDATLVADKQRTVKPRGGTETILVVEDEPQVRRMTRIVLERRGYHVLEAGTGDEALHIWETAGHVDALLTDVMMPGMTGRELAERLQHRDAQLKVIFFSGYSAELAGRDMVFREGELFLQKPCPPDVILETVRRCLDASH